VSFLPRSVTHPPDHCPWLRRMRHSPQYRHAHLYRASLEGNASPCAGARGLWPRFGRAIHDRRHRPLATARCVGPASEGCRGPPSPPDYSQMSVSNDP
jgi:hypothetical protein